MGAWGAGSFDNDAALDWLIDAETASDGREMVERALSDPFSQDDAFVGSGVESVALAAAEIVAGLRGYPIDLLPEEAEILIEDLDSLSDEQVMKLSQSARKAVRSIKDSSELQELWDGDEEWLAEVNDLLRRLEAE